MAVMLNWRAKSTRLFPWPKFSLVHALGLAPAVDDINLSRRQRSHFSFHSTTILIQLTRIFSRRSFDCSNHIPKITAETIANAGLFAFLHYPVAAWPWGLLQIGNAIAYALKVGRV